MDNTTDTKCTRCPRTVSATEHRNWRGHCHDCQSDMKAKYDG